MAGTKKKSKKEKRTIVFSDQSGFYLLPALVRTYAPKGKTPILEETLSRDHLSAMSGITPTGKLFMRVQKDSYKGKDVVRFLKHLLANITGKILLIWDRSPIHRAKEVKTFLFNGAAKRLHIEQLPAYAPELNPDEGIWNYLKNVELRNICCTNLKGLNYELLKAKERLRHKKDIILACIKQPGFY